MKKILLSFFILVLTSCSEKVEVLDFSIYPAEKFKSILIDFHIVEGALTIEPTITDSAARAANQSYLALLEKYETTKEEALKNLNYYSSRPDEFIIILDDVIDSLNVLNLSLQ